MPSPSPAQLGDLSVDLQVEVAKLSRLVEGLEAIAAWFRSPGCSTDALRTDRSGSGARGVQRRHHR